MQPAYLKEAIWKAKHSLEGNTEATPFTLYFTLQPFVNQIQSHIDQIKNSLIEKEAAVSPLQSVEQGRGEEDSFNDLSFQIFDLKEAVQMLERANNCSILPNGADYEFLDKYIRIDTNALLNAISILEDDCRQISHKYFLQRDFLLCKEAMDTGITLDPKSPRYIAGHYLSLAQGNTDKARDMLMDMAQSIHDFIGKEKFIDLAQTELTILSALELINLGNKPSSEPIKVQDLQSKEEAPEPEYPEDPELTPEPTGEYEEEGYADEEEDMDGIPSMSIPEELKKGQEPPAYEAEPEPEPEEPVKIEPELYDPVPPQVKPAAPPQQQTQPKPSAPAPEPQLSPEEALFRKIYERGTLTHQEYNVFKQGYITAQQQLEQLLQRQASIQQELGDMSNAPQDLVMKFTQVKDAATEVRARLKEAARRLDKLNKDIRDEKSPTRLTWSKSPTKTMSVPQRTMNANNQ